MFNLAELLTLIIGSLVALVFIDGIRRSLRNRASFLKVDLIDSSELMNKDFEKEWLGEYDEENNSENLLEKVIAEPSDEIEEIDLPYNFYPSHQLLIINQSSKESDIFSYESIASILDDHPFVFDERGYFILLDQDNSPLFSILNGKNPGTFLNSISSSDVAFVFDPNSVLNPVEVFGDMYEIAQIISKSFGSDLLDENRNILTKQMLEHMRQEAQEFQRQKLAIVS